MHFEHLSFDLHVDIFGFLEPFDILSLRKTCRILHHATSQRIVWINALYRVCVRNTIFMPTFPVHDMSVLALEYAATGPDRFLCKKAGDFGFLIARSHRIIPSNGYEFREIFLVPGGRYLVTLSVISLAVWDLGIPGNSLTKARTNTPISTIPIPVAQSDALMNVHPSEDGKGLTILLNSGEENSLFSIFRIYPDDENPVLLKIAEMALSDSDSMASDYSLLGNKLIYLQGPTLNVWDFKEDAWACIEVPDDPEHFIVAGTAILLFYCDTVSIWEYPPLSTSKPLFGSPPSCIPPTCSLKTSIDWNGAEASRGPCDWYSGSTQPLLIDLSYGSKLQRLQVSHINEDWNNSAIVDMGTHPHATVDTYYRMFECCRFCNDTLVFWCTYCGVIDAHVSSLPSATHSPILEPVKPMYIRDTLKHGGDIPSTLCPFSGRFANIDDTHKLKIMDFLSESLPVLGNLSDF